MADMMNPNNKKKPLDPVPGPAVPSAGPTQAAPAASEDKKLASELKLRSSQEYLNDLEALSADPQYSRGVPSETQKSLQSAIQQAKQARNEALTRNEWLEVAQTLGRAVAQFGAAQQGLRTGRDMSNLNMGPNIDYGARSDREQRIFEEERRGLESLSEQERRAKDAEYSKKEGYLREALRTSREREGDEERMKRAELAERERANREVGREKDRLTREDKNKSELERKLELAELNKQENTLQKQLRSAQTLANTLATDDDLTSKSKNKLAEKYGSLAADAGIDPAALQNIGERSMGEGVLGTGLFRKEDKQKKAALMSEEVVAPIRNMLDAIQARKRELAGGVTRKETLNGSPNDPKIEEYAKQYKLDYDAAKKVLVGRGYKPAE